MPGPVSTFLRDQLSNRLQRHHVVVWYDPAEIFKDVVPELTIAGLHTLALQDSYFRLRREAEPLLTSMRSGKADGKKLLLYVPCAPLESRENVLLPIESLGTVFSTDLSSLARDALKGKLPAEKVDEWRKLPGLTLAKLDELAVGEEDIGALDAVFGKVGPQEVGFRFVRYPEHSDALKQQKLIEPLRTLLEKTFGVAIGSDVRAVTRLRDAFVQRVLLHEFLDDLTEIPAELAHLRLPERPAQVAACRELATRLRDTKPIEDEYRTWAREAERLFDLKRIDYSAEQLGRRDTFEFEAEYALRHVRDLAVAAQWAEAKQWVDERSRSFWAATDETLRSRWKAIGLACELRITADRVIKGVPPKNHSASKWVEWYTAPGEDGGWRVDLLLRRMDALSGSLLDQPELEEIVHLARERASSAEQLMAERFGDRLHESGADLAGLPAQTDVFHRNVTPFLESSGTTRKVVFVLADALRYEMGQELSELLRSSGVAELSYAIATPPTITKIGMAAMVPGAENGIELAAGGTGIIARVGGEALPGMEHRRKRFESEYGNRVTDLTLDDCLSLSHGKLDQRVNKVDLLLLRSQDLDAIGELDNVHHARTAMSRVIPDLQMGMNRLARLGFEEFVVCADHGFLLREDISDAMKLDLPAGEVLEAHRRCAIGRHLSKGANYAVFRAADFGLGGDLELAFPRGINVFRTAGNTAYHHGGLSLQELVVPVLRFTPHVERAAAQKQTVELEFKSGKKITNAIFQVELSYQAADLFDQQGARRFRVEAAEAKKDGKVVGTAVQASRGFHEAGAEIELQSGDKSMVVIYIADPDALGGTGDLELRVADVDAGETILRKKVKYDLAF